MSVRLARILWLIGLIAAGIVLAASPASRCLAQDRGAPGSDPILRVDTPMHQAMIRRLAVDTRGGRVVTAGDDKSIRVWQLSSQPRSGRTANLVQTLRVPIDTGHEGQLFALAVSPDGTRIAAGGWTCWDWERAGCVYVFDVESGDIVRRIKGLPDAVSALAWSPDGRHLAIGLQGRAGVQVVRTDTFDEVAADRAYEDKVMELAYDARGQLAAVALDGRIRVYRPDHALHARVRVAGGQQLATVRFRPDGSRIAVGFLDAAAVSILDAATLTLIDSRRAEDGMQRNLPNVAWSLDGTTLYAAGERIRAGISEGANVLHRWRGDGPVAHDRLPIPAQRVSELQALPAGELAYGAEDPRFGIVDTQGRLVLDRAADITDFSASGFVLRASADGSSVGFTGSDGVERLFVADAQPGTRAPSASVLANAIGEFRGWRVEPANDRMALRVNGTSLQLDDYERVRSQAFNASGDALFIGTEWALRRIDPAGRELWRVHLAVIVRTLVVSGDGQWVIAALSDGTIRWYRARDGLEALAYFPHANGTDWIAWTGAGYYMSSLQGDQYVGWHVNRGADRAPDFFRAVQFERVLYRPDIVTGALRIAARPNSRQVRVAERFDADRLAEIAPPRLAIRVLGVTQSGTGTSRARIRVTAERGAQPLRELTVYVNEIPVTRAQDRTLGWTESTRLSRELEVPLSATANDIRVESYTSVSMGVAERQVTVQAQGAPPGVSGDLYVLAIGNNQFPGLPAASNLEFAARDAEAMAAALAEGGRSVFGAVHVEVISDDRHRKGDRQTVLDALAFTRKARAQDTVVIFLASHGVSDAAGNYWFVPRDASADDLKRLENGTVGGDGRYDSLLSWTVFFDALRDTIGRRLLIVDTCQARDMEGRFESFALLKRSAASRFALMVAAQSNEESQEYPPGRHGLFTYALLQALASNAPSRPVDADGDGKVSFAEWFAAAAPVVAQLQDRELGHQTPALMAPASLAETPIATVNGHAMTRATGTPAAR